MNIQNYPNFKPLEKEDLSIFTQAFKTNPPLISEFTFTNLYSWRDTYKLKASWLDDFIILCSESEAPMRFFDPIGTGDKRKAMEKILKDFKGSFIRLPEETIAFLSDDARFRIELDMDNSDYVYKAEDLITLRGRKYDGKRNLIRNFQSNNTYEYIPITAANAHECLQFEERWCSIKNCDRIVGLSNERRALQEMVRNFSDFELIGGLIKLQKDIYALALAQKLNSDTLVMHGLKADPHISGLYQAMLWEFLSKEAKGLAYVNLEQDVGQEGLRKAKQSYHPARMIKKYTLSALCEK